MTSVRDAARALLTAMEEWGGTLSFDAGVALCRLRHQLNAPPPGLEEVRARLKELWQHGQNSGGDADSKWHAWHDDEIEAERDCLIAELLAMYEARDK